MCGPVAGYRSMAVEGGRRIYDSLPVWMGDVYYGASVYQVGESSLITFWTARNCTIAKACTAIHSGLSR